MARAASDVLWYRVQLLRTAQLVLIVALPVTAAVSAVIWPSLRVFSAYLGFVMTIVDIFINDTVDQIRREGAQLQDKFDSIAFGLARTHLRIQNDLDAAQIGELARRQPGKRSTRNMDWYTPALAALPIAFGRIACMRESVHWDCNIRKMWAAITLGVPVIVFVSLAAWAILVHQKADQLFMSVLAPLAPALIWSLREWKEQSSSVTTYEALREQLRETWGAGLEGAMSEMHLERAAADFMWCFMSHRSATSPIPNVIYAIQRKQQAASAADAADILIREFKQYRPANS